MNGRAGHVYFGGKGGTHDGSTRQVDRTETGERERHARGCRDPPCPHVTLIPKWDSTADMGHEDKATGYDCEGCKEPFTAEQGRALRRTEAERVKHAFEA